MSDNNISHAISGGLSGLVSMAVTYPLVTLSTNAQTKTTESFEATSKEEEEDEEEFNDTDSTKSAALKLPLRTIPKSVSQEFEKPLEETNTPVSKLSKLTKIIKKLLIRLQFYIQHSKKFYAGLESALVGIVAVNFSYYYIYNLVGSYLKKLNSGSLNVKDSLITGLTAGIISRILTNPIWVANTRMTVKQKMEIENKNKDKKQGKDNMTSSTIIDVSKQNTFTVIKEILQNEGINGLFAGLGPALILVSSPVIQFTVFEQLKNLLIRIHSKKGSNKSISSFEALVLGSFGKLIAILLTYPYYTIRARMHVSSKKDNSFKFLYNVVTEEGFGALYRGLDAKLLQSVLSAGLIFYFKEEMMYTVGLFVNGCNAHSQKLNHYAKQLKLKR